MTTFDVLGIGFGPANLALAIAIEEEGLNLSAHFIEAKENLFWQGEMMLEGSNIQNHPSRDLVSLRNPRSRYSFLNYLFEEGRLVEHLNLPMEYPLRREYAHYVRWATGHFTHVADFGTRASSIAIVDEDGENVYEVTTEAGGVYRGRSLVFAPGRSPYIPAQFEGIPTDRVVHLTRYLGAIAALPEEPRSVAVIGGSQSAVELTLDLARRYPASRITTYTRSYSLRSKDNSPFSEEGYFPEHTSYYYNTDRRGKETLDRYMRPTNYSSSDLDVLQELYIKMYEQRLDDEQRLFVQGNRQVREAVPEQDRVRLVLEEVHTGEIEEDEVDLVILATGFRDLGPRSDQERFPPMLADVIEHFRFDEEGYLAVTQDYRLESFERSIPRLFLNGLCESTHGIGDSGSFSLLSLRAQAILRNLQDYESTRAPQRDSSALATH